MDQEIQELICCPKTVHEPPRKTMKEERGHLRNEMIVRSADEKFKFRVFMRINQKFNENFSIGLDYFPDDEPGSITLLRYNGPHGEHISFPHHVLYHIHKTNAECVNTGLKPERNIIAADNYASFQEALRQFLKDINLTDAAKHFPSVFERTFWPTEEVQ